MTHCLSAGICDGSHCGHGAAALSAHSCAARGCSGGGRLHPDHSAHLFLPVRDGRHCRSARRPTPVGSSGVPLGGPSILDRAGMEWLLPVCHLACTGVGLSDGLMYALQGLAQELRRRLGLNLFNFDLLRPSPNQPGTTCTTFLQFWSRCYSTLNLPFVQICYCEIRQECRMQ
jgi:hypothetical protein